MLLSPFVKKSVLYCPSLHSLPSCDRVAWFASCGLCPAESLKEKPTGTEASEGLAKPPRQSLNNWKSWKLEFIAPVIIGKGLHRQDMQQPGLGEARGPCIMCKSANLECKTMEAVNKHLLRPNKASGSQWNSGGVLVLLVLLVHLGLIQDARCMCT
ncbi:hypothetical protein F5Y15DRAFT_369155 [Xylariaceae sp. FL0016]|nr:hypothetical protein F5Y15DRAFT_369155 [Xylariaceae sp. FL0016]